MQQEKDKKVERELDKSIADTFPASDPPSQTQPVTATPTQPRVPLTQTGMTGDEIHVYRVIEPRKAAEPFSGAGFSIFEKKNTRSLIRTTPSEPPVRSASSQRRAKSERAGVRFVLLPEHT